MIGQRCWIVHFWTKSRQTPLRKSWHPLWHLSPDPWESNNRIHRERHIWKAHLVKGLYSTDAYCQLATFCPFQRHHKSTGKPAYFYFQFCSGKNQRSFGFVKLTKSYGEVKSAPNSKKWCFFETLLFYTGNPIVNLRGFGDYRKI